MSVPLLSKLIESLRKMPKFSLLPCFLASFLSAFSQTPKIITLQNPSFEGFPHAAQTPDGWLDCRDFPRQTPPDTQPIEAFGHPKKAQNGRTYLGLVVRSDSSTEGVYQKLTSPLLKGVTYKFSVWAHSSATFKSVVTNKEEDFKTPTLIEFWGNTGKISQKLAASEPIAANDWKQLNFVFTPTANFSNFIIKAYFNGDRPYNGNVMIDNLSALVPKLVQKTEPTKTVVSVKEQTIILDIPFEKNSYTLLPSSYVPLNEVITKLKASPFKKITIEGHTNLTSDFPAEKEFAADLASNRAKSVKDYFIEKGIPPTNLNTQGFTGSKNAYVKIKILR